MELDLGRWALIDIETTGTDPNYDSIIDIGFLQFDGTELVRTYESLVRCEEEVSFFIQKLTGIDNKMLKKAPLWERVEPEVMDLFGHHLLAHNADFERNFLSEHFEAVDDGTQRESYEDSMPFLALLFPYKSSLKLENFIVDWGLAEHEAHRGFQDSVDLLKVLLIAVRLVRMDRELNATINSLFHKYELKNWWYYKFFNLYDDQLDEIAEQIDFDLDEALEKARAFEFDQVTPDIELDPPSFSYEFSGQNIQEILRDEEKIQEKVPFYKHRDSQEVLALKTGQSFKNGVHSLVQAPTGTGKTLGYLLPSALFSIAEKKQVLVATGTKTLQHQAITKDVPQLRKLLSLDEDQLKVRRLVGSSNHLCELLFRQEIDEQDLLFQGREFEEKFSDIFYELLFFFNSRHDYSQLILRDDLPFVFKAKMKTFRDREKDIAVDFRACTGNSCPFKNDCSYIRGLREAKDANIIIGNHALTFSWPRAFPRPEFIVLDEAHKIEDETTKAFTLEATEEGLKNLAKSLGNMQGIGSLFYLLAQNEGEEGSSTPVINKIREQTQNTYQMLNDHLLPLPDLMETFFKKRPKYTDKFWNEVPMIDKAKSNDNLALAIFNHLESLKFILHSYQQDLLPYTTMFEAKNLVGDNQIIALTRFETFYAMLEDHVVAIEAATLLKGGLSHSLKFHEEHGFAVQSAPVNVGQILHDQLLQTSKSVVYTSATLGNAHGDQGSRGIEWATGYSYLEPERRFRKGFYLPATYDYEKNTKVFLCDDTPGFYESHFVESVLSPVIKLIKDLGGRALLLFSARKRFETAREILLKELDGEIPVFVQGMGNNVVDEFKENGKGVLLGMESFGEGIDVPGEALQFVFIDKVPDLRMDLVINDRRQFYEANIGNEFTDYYLSHRTRSLHQKLGRLMRRENDIGGVIIVDNRIRRWKGRTMEKMVKLMEPYKLERAPLEEACEQVKDFVLSFHSPESQALPTNDPYQDHSNI